VNRRLRLPVFFQERKAMRRNPLRTLLPSFCLCCLWLLSLGAFSQDTAGAPICVALPTSSASRVPEIEVRDRLVKWLDQHKGDRKIEWLALESPPGGRAIVEARRKNCAFVLYTHVRAVQTASEYMPSYSDQTIGTRPMVVATVEFLLRQMTDGATKAEGAAKSEQSVSDRDAILQAVERAGGGVLADMEKGGSVSAEARSAAGTLEKLVPAPRREMSAGGSFCGWLPGEIPHGEAVRGVCEWAITLPQQMPNFICQQSTSRYQGRNKVPVDLITATVRYEDGDESYSDLKVNGKTAQESAARAAGLWSSGQFEGGLRAIFHKRNEAVFAYAGENTLNGRAAWIFTFQIAQQNEPLWQLRGTDVVIAPAYGGELWVDQKTGTVLRFRSQAKELPAKFPMQSAEVETDYRNVEFGDGTAFVLPVASSVATQYQGMDPTRNVVEFRGCHKFRAMGRVLASGNVGTGGTTAVENPEESLKAELEQNQTIYDILREEAIREDEARLDADRLVQLSAAMDAAQKKLAELEYERRAQVAREDAVRQSAALPPARTPVETANGQGEPLGTVKVSVNLVPVSVVARDSKGHAVGDLGREDFRLFDERKPQVITRFVVEKNGVAAAPPTLSQKNEAAAETPAEEPKAAAPENDVAYLFDDIGLRREDLLATAAAAAKHLSKMHPGDRAAVFTTSGEVGVNFTANSERLQAALNMIKPHPIPGWDCPPMSYFEADLIVNHADVAASELAVSEAMACAHSYTAAMAGRQAQSRALEVVNTGRANSAQTLGILGEVIERTSAMAGRRMIVLVSPGFVMPDTDDKAMALIDRAVQAGIVVNTLDATGLGDTPESNAQGDPSRSQFDRQEALARSEVMADLAYGTGGTFFHHNNDMNEGFRRTADIPEFMYVLGFAPQKLDGKFHKLKVTLSAREKLSVQARPGYYAGKGQGQ
jgi:VWFA-related protein